ncbi:MAG: hypothetical protein Q9216_003692 [Gyalolechia sp. 2 TL-2023]
MDCCYAAKAFGPQHIGKRKFEMIVSSGPKNRVPAPHQDGSFTKNLSQVLKSLLEKNKDGFVTSQLYREIYHSIKSDVKPWLFDQGRRDYGRIMLRPQPPKAFNDMEPRKGDARLNLTLRLNKKPDSITMNELALSLQYLPHIDHIRFDKLYAPRKQIEDFMLSVRQAARLRPLIRRIHAMRREKQLETLHAHDSFKKLYKDQKATAAFDWSSALDDHNPSPTSPTISRNKKTFTWPPAEADPLSKVRTLSNRFFSVDYRFAAPAVSSIPGFSQLRRAKTIAASALATNEDIIPKPRRSKSWDKHPTLPNVQRPFGMEHNWTMNLGSDDLSHAFMWTVLCYTVMCFWYYMQE